MSSITVRDIPESIFNKIRTLSKIERRSINSELLLLIERGLEFEIERKTDTQHLLTTDSQLKIWRGLCGSWEDDRSAEEINRDIYMKRTKSRKVEF